MIQILRHNSPAVKIAMKLIYFDKNYVSSLDKWCHEYDIARYYNDTLSHHHSLDSKKGWFLIEIRETRSERGRNVLKTWHCFLKNEEVDNVILSETTTCHILTTLIHSVILKSCMPYLWYVLKTQRKWKLQAYFSFQKWKIQLNREETLVHQLLLTEMK